MPSMMSMLTALPRAQQVLIPLAGMSVFAGILSGVQSMGGEFGFEILCSPAAQARDLRGVQIVESTAGKKRRSDPVRRKIVAALNCFLTPPPYLSFFLSRNENE